MAVVKPPKSILDKAFAYVPSHRTDVRETIERARQQINDQKYRERQIAEEKLRKCIQMKRAK